jgi:hypothetical protein
VEIGYIYIRGNPAPTPSHVICEGNYFDLNYVVIITRFCTTVSNSKWPRLHRDMHGHLLLFGRRSASNAPLDPKHCIQATNAMTSDQTIHLNTGVIPVDIQQQQSFSGVGAAQCVRLRQSLFPRPGWSCETRLARVLSLHATRKQKASLFRHQCLSGNWCVSILFFLFQTRRSLSGLPLYQSARPSSRTPER